MNVVNWFEIPIKNISWARAFYPKAGTCVASPRRSES